MASSVDLPQPEGPAIDRYSPFATSMWIADSACVSTSSVTKTLLTFSSRSSGCEPLSIVIYPFYENRENLVQSNPIVIIVLRHVRENHLVANLQAILDLYGIDGAAAKLHLHFVGIFPVRFQFEELHRGVLLSEYRPPDIHDVVELGQLDGAVHAQIGTRSGGKRALQSHIHRHRAVQNRGIDARNTALDQPVRAASGQTCVDDGDH